MKASDALSSTGYGREAGGLEGLAGEGDFTSIRGAGTGMLSNLEGRVGGLGLSFVGLGG